MRRLLLLISFMVSMVVFSACNSSSNSSSNPLLEEWDTLFGVPPFDKIKTGHYIPAIERAMSLNNEEIEAIVTSTDRPTFENVILAYDNSGKLLSDICTIFWMVDSAETNDQMQAISEELSPMLSAHSDNIRLNETLFQKIKAVYDERLSMELDAEQLRLVEKIYDSFVRGGALLEGEAKERLKSINEELSLLSFRFGQNILAENNSYKLILSAGDLDGLPANVKSAAKDAAKAEGLKDKWIFTLHSPSWIPFLTYSDRRDLREELYRAYISRGNHNNEVDNKQIINDMIRLRIEKSQLLGYKSYSDYVISDQMAVSSDKVYSLLDEIWDPALARAEDELAQMDLMLQKDKPGTIFESWDWWYYAEKLRKKSYNLDEEMIRPYLSLSNVQNGIFMLANRLYGITFRPIAVPRYHEECSAYEVIDTDNSHIGVLYFDFHPRAGKSQGAWCGNYREQRYENGERVAPVVSIVCNFTRPSGSTPALLSLDETETLFHEFGHALHFLFHDVKYRGLSEVEGDFVELPSQIMENWAFEPEMLKQYAFHHRTNKVMPDDLIEKIRNSSLFNQGFTTTELVAAALSDLDIHSLTAYEPFDVEKFENDALGVRRRLISQIEPRYHYTYFAHIFSGGYSSGYYFYLWAEVLDQDAFSAFKESGDLFNRKLAKSFREDLLSRGGSADGMSMYTKFRGAEPNKDALLRSRGLISLETDEIETDQVDSVALSRVDSLMNRRERRSN